MKTIELGYDSAKSLLQILIEIQDFDDYLEAEPTNYLPLKKEIFKQIGFNIKKTTFKLTDKNFKMLLNFLILAQHEESIKTNEYHAKPDEVYIKIKAIKRKARELYKIIEGQK